MEAIYSKQARNVPDIQLYNTKIDNTEQTDRQAEKSEVKVCVCVWERERERERERGRRKKYMHIKSTK